jgi:hypothetical protein
MIRPFLLTGPQIETFILLVRKFVHFPDAI